MICFVKIPIFHCFFKSAVVKEYSHVCRVTRVIKEQLYLQTQKIMLKYSSKLTYDDWMHDNYIK